MMHKGIITLFNKHGLQLDQGHYFRKADRVKILDKWLNMENEGGYYQIRPYPAPGKVRTKKVFEKELSFVRPQAIYQNRQWV